MMLYKLLKCGFARNNRATDAPKARSGSASSLRIPVILTVVIASITLILSVLCVFAGHKPGMMENYAIFTLNVSRIGENMINNVDNKIMSVNINLKRDVPTPQLATVTTVRTTITAAPISLVTMAPRGLESKISSLESGATSKVHSVESAISSKATAVKSAAASRISSASIAAKTEIIAAINKAYGGVINELGLSDAYSMHMMTTCKITYRYHNGTNVTVGAGEAPPLSGKGGVYEHVDSCTTHSALDPLGLIKIIYWAGIVCNGVALVLCIAGLVFTSKKIATFNIIASGAALFFLFLASAVTQGFAVGASKFINFIGQDFGIRGYKGGKFIAMTWATTALILLNLVIWILLHVQRSRAQKRAEGLGPGAGRFLSSKSMRRNRPDRTSHIAMSGYPISAPEPVRVDMHGNAMI